ncbi:MAG: ATP synthase F1 subunit delta [Armatimonadota bacterium]
MLARRIASRYAEALFDLAQQQGKTEEWEAQLGALAAVFAATPDLHTVLTHPEVTLQRKGEILHDAFGSKVAPEIIGLLSLLLQRSHEPDIATIHDVFRELWNAARQVLPVTVTTAVPMSDGQQQVLAETLAQRLGSTVQLHPQVDPEIIAGMIVQMGDRVIDASALSTLGALKEAMKNA